MQAGAQRDAGVGVLAVQAVLGLSAIAAELPIDAELVGNRPKANANELPGVGLDRLGEGTCRGFNFAEIVIAQLYGEVAIELVAGEQAPRRIFVVTGDAGAGTAARVLELRLANRRADVERAHVHLGCRG